MSASSNGGAPRGLVARGASPAEAAAIVAALERFMRDTAPPPFQQAGAADGWLRAAALEAVERLPEQYPREPWINT